MQLYGLSRDPIEAAKALCNQHVNSQTRETMQILVSLLWHWNVSLSGPVNAGEHGLLDVYKPTHVRHPCVMWAAACRDHARWTYTHAKALCKEFSDRHGGHKKHLCEYHIDHWHAHIEMHGFPKDMPESISVDEWIDKFPKGTVEWRIANINPPFGCHFGVIALQMIGPRLGHYNDWTTSYQQYYTFKQAHSFKRPMSWGMYASHKTRKTAQSGSHIIQASV